MSIWPVYVRPASNSFVAIRNCLSKTSVIKSSGYYWVIESGIVVNRSEFGQQKYNQTGPHNGKVKVIDGLNMSPSRDHVRITTVENIYCITHNGWWWDRLKIHLFFFVAIVSVFLYLHTASIDSKTKKGGILTYTWSDIIWK